VSSPRLRPGSGFGLGFGAFLVSFLPLSLLPMETNITRMNASIDYDQILARYWELANLDLKSTKGTITGQLKALELLCEELRRAPEGSTAKPRIYQSEWMVKK
jgi:hypothetical protein